MNRTIRLIYPLSALLILISATSGTAYAAQKTTFIAQCFNLYGTVVACYGDMADMAADTMDQSLYATFEKYTYGSVTTLSFGMQSNNQSYYCIAPSSMLDTWNTLMATARHGFFLVEMDTSTGVCTTASAAISSAYD